METATDIVKLNEQMMEVGRKLAPVTAKLTDQVTFIEVAGRPEVAMRLVRNADGSVERHEYFKHIPPRAHTAASLAGLCEVVVAFAKESPIPQKVEGDELKSEAAGDPGRWLFEPTINGRPADLQGPVEVWVGDGAVVAVLDGGGRRLNSAELRLQFSEPFRAVCALAVSPGGEPKWLDQRGIIELLRDDIAAEYMPADVISQLRALKITTDGQASGEVRSGRESLGKSVQREMVGWNDELENIAVTLPVFDNVLIDGQPITVTVQCTLLTNLAEGAFRLRPRAGELARVRREAAEVLMKEVVRCCAGKHVSIFHGNR